MVVFLLNGVRFQTVPEVKVIGIQRRKRLFEDDIP